MVESSQDKGADRIILFAALFTRVESGERLNSDLKGQIRSGLVALTQGDVKRKVRSSMKIIQNNPARVRKYFEDLRVAYAA